jgi:ketosteroid isomerase-like protein
MLDTIFAALTEMMQAVNAGDAGRYARLYAENAVITIHGGGSLEGRAAIEKYEVELLREFPGARLAFYDVWQQGPVAVVHYGVNGKTAGGQAMGHEGLLFYRFAPGGLIQEERRYLDSFTPMAQLGALGAGPVRALPALPSEMKSHAAKGSPGEAANVALVRTAFAALDARKQAEFLSKTAPDAVIDEMLEAQPSSGRTGVTGWYERWTSAVPDARTEIDTILGAGDAVLVEAVVRGTLKGPLGRLRAADKPFEAHRAAIVQVRDGKIARLTAFMNGKELAQAVGQWPPRPDH